MIKIANIDATIIFDSENQDQFKEELKFFVDRNSISDNSRKVNARFMDVDSTSGMKVEGLSWGYVYKVYPVEKPPRKFFNKNNDEPSELNFVVIQIANKNDIFKVIGILLSDNALSKIKNADKGYLAGNYIRDHSIVYNFDISGKKGSKVSISKYLNDKNFHKKYDIFNPCDFVETEKLKERVIANLLAGYYKKEN